MRYSVVLIPEPEEGGYSVVVPSLPGCFSQGETADEALANAKEAIEVHLEGLAMLHECIPQETLSPIFASVEVQPDLSLASASFSPNESREA